MIKVLIALVAAVVALWVVHAAYQSTECRYEGYAKHIWYEGGRRNDPLGGPSSDLFPAMEHRAKFETVGISYDNYDRFVECADAEHRAKIVNVVRFAVSPQFNFTPSTKYADAGQVPNFWSNEPIGDYVGVGVQQKYLLFAGDPRHPQSWLTPKKEDLAIELPGRKEFINSLDLAWLKDEPLDQAHLIGIWQAGWLFRSVKAGHYVWIN